MPSLLFDSISQPTLLLDSEIARLNLHMMVEKVKKAGVRFRPHFKTHQSAQIGEWFREVGVNAITVSSVDMAEYFAMAGWNDILIAFSLNIRQLECIQALARKIHLGVLVEDRVAVQALKIIAPEQVGVWIKVDAGAHRTGMDWQSIDAIQGLVSEIHKYDHLHFRGLLTHSGNTYHCDSTEEIIHAFRTGVDRLNELRSVLEDAGESCLVSVGDTPGCSLCEDFSGIDELRPGNFIFYDAQQLQIGSCTAAQISVAVACPIVALHPERSEVVVYGGAIHLSKDWIERKEGYSFGLVALQKEDHWGEPIPGAYVRSLSQEHGVVKFEEGIPSGLKIGDLLFVFPAHSCLTVQALKNYLTLKGEVIRTMKS
ncbi:MAG: alanine racemase [Anaerolineaceae bacterium]